MVLVKNWKLIHSSFCQLDQENVFHDTLERKTYIFPRGIIHGLGKKLASFPSLYFRQKRVKISVSVYFRKKKTPS